MARTFGFPNTTAATWLATSGRSGSGTVAGSTPTGSRHGSDMGACVYHTGWLAGAAGEDHLDLGTWTSRGGRNAELRDRDHRRRRCHDRSSRHRPRPRANIKSASFRLSASRQFSTTGRAARRLQSGIGGNCSSEGSTARRRSGNRVISLLIATVVSMRARLAPRQKWAPLLNAMWWFGVRVMSKASGSRRHRGRGWPRPAAGWRSPRAGW